VPFIYKEIIVAMTISKADLLKLQKSLKSDAAIAAKYGISRQAVCQMRLKYGIASLQTGSIERNKKMLQLYKAGLSE
jgi:hypothetical protein